MAIFGNINVIKKQFNDPKFLSAFDYLMKALDENDCVNKRLNSYKIGAFEKIKIDEKNFALEQTYFSKKREDCFFESHKTNIDVQLIVESEEIIEVENVSNLNVSQEYSEEIDFMKYEHSNQSSSIILQKGDVAIFFPEDGHMSCVKLNESKKVIKTVVKVAV